MRKIKIFLISCILLALSSFANAQSVFRFDLENLKNQDAFLVKAYDITKIQNAWEFIKNSSINLSPIKIGIVDTGADASRQEFNNPKVDFGSSTAGALIDSHAPKGHGTQVVGIIGANNVLGSGGVLSADSPQMNGIVSGILKETQYKLEVENFRTAAATQSSAVFAALEKLLKRNPMIVNMSISMSKCSAISKIRRGLLGLTECYKTDVDFVDTSRAYMKIFNMPENQHALFVTAAGNWDVDADVTLPAAIKLPNTITVGAIDLNDERAAFVPLIGAKSNFGFNIDISAPGKSVYAPKPGNLYEDPKGIDAKFSGTSASAPMVTGVAGLIKAINPTLTPAQIKDILIRNADPIQTDKPIGGRLNALKAVCDPLVGLNCVPTTPPQLPIWPMLQKNAQRVGLADVSGPPFATSSAVTLKWQKDLGIASSFPPLIGAQAVYVGAGNNLLAFDKTNGNQIWQANIPAGAVNGALGPDGTIYVCGLNNTSQQSILTAVNPINGAIKWQFQVGLSRPCNSPAVAQNGVIYTTVPPPFNTQVAVIVAINSDGTEKWRHEEGNTATTPPSLSNDESQVYVGFRDIFKAFNAQSGQALWDKNVPFFPLLITVDSQDRVLNQTSNGPIVAFSKFGAFLWQNGNASAMSLYPGNKIFTVNPSGFAFLNAIDGSFVSSGSWPGGLELPGRAFPIVDKDGIIYIPLAIFGNPSQVRLFAFDGNGTVRWTFDVSSNLNIVAIGSSALNDDGTLYLLAQGMLFAF